MGLLARFRKRKQDKPIQFDLEAQELSAETRRKKAELRHLHLELEIEEAKQDLIALRSEQFDESPETMLYNILKTAMSKGQNTTTHPSIIESSAAVPQSAPVVLSRQQINEYLKGLSSVERGYINDLSDSELKEAIKAKIPNISPESLDLCLIVAREQK